MDTSSLFLDCSYPSDKHLCYNRSYACSHYERRSLRPRDGDDCVVVVVVGGDGGGVELWDLEEPDLKAPKLREKRAVKLILLIWTVKRAKLGALLRADWEGGAGDGVDSGGGFALCLNDTKEMLNRRVKLDALARLSLGGDSRLAVELQRIGRNPNWDLREFLVFVDRLGVVGDSKEGTEFLRSVEVESESDDESEITTEVTVVDTFTGAMGKAAFEALPASGTRFSLFVREIGQTHLPPSSSSSLSCVWVRKLVR